MSEVRIAATVQIRSAPGLLEPGVVGWMRPVLLLPLGIEKRLTAPELNAVLAHELCHVQRRDNFTAAIHMITEAVFWFRRGHRNRAAPPRSGRCDGRGFGIRSCVDQTEQIE